MGMYDEVACDYKLPTTPPEFAAKPGHPYQTKDLDCSLSLYQKCRRAPGFIRGDIRHLLLYIDTRLRIMPL